MAQGAAAAILAPHDEERRLSAWDGASGSDGGGFGGRPGISLTKPPQSVDPSGTRGGQPGVDIGPSVYMPAAQPAPVAPVPPPIEAPKPPTAADPEVGKAEKKVDEEMQHGFAANILAGAMFQSTPELARNILLGN